MSRPFPALRRRTFLVSAGARFAASAPPGLILVIAGGWRAQALPFAGEPALRAPHLARIAAEGIHFSRAYTACPAAVAGRAAILSGRFPHAAGAPALVTQMHAAGFATLLTGDAAAALEFLRTHHNRPSLLVLDLALPAEAAAVHASRRLVLRDNIPPEAEAQARDALAAYYDRCFALDTLLGRFIPTRPDRLFVFTSTHGDLLGAHGQFGADEPFEESCRVPLLVRCPARLKPGRTLDFLVSLTDLAPTLLGLCGIEAPAALHGRDLSPLLLETSGNAPESLYAEGRLRTGGEWRMVVRALDKIAVTLRAEVTHLYNLGQDPHEMDNLARSGAHRRTRDELLALLRTWVFRTNDRLAR